MTTYHCINRSHIVRAMVHVVQPNIDTSHILILILMCMPSHFHTHKKHTIIINISIVIINIIINIIILLPAYTHLSESAALV